MKIKKRFYNRPDDYDKVFQLLKETYEPGGKFINWHPSRWEYMHYHSYYQDKYSEKSGVWEADGKIVAIVHNELGEGEAFFSFRQEYSFLLEEMLDHAEEYLFNTETRKLRVHANDFNDKLIQLLEDRNYKNKTDSVQHYTICFYDINDQFPSIHLPQGYRIKSLKDDNDLVKVDRVQWRGFNHPGEPPIESVEDRKLMQSAPNFRKDLTIVVESPSGEFVSYVGMWLENNVGYVEPVCTDPEYRKLGLGKAALLESVRRCIQLGATEIIVESSLPIYLSAGFVPSFIRYRWDKVILK